VFHRPSPTLPRMTRVALLADVHGNYPALETVLGESKLQTFDELVFAGDLVMNGPQPEECLLRIMTSRCDGVIGNTDLEVLAGSDAVAAWTCERLSADALGYLAELSLAPRDAPRHVQPPRRPRRRPRHSAQQFRPSYPRASPPRNYVCRADVGGPEVEAQAIVRGVEAGLLVFGHLHYTSVRRFAHLYVASLGSVGFPFDGDPRATYAVAEWTGDSWALEHHRGAYDHERVARTLETSTIPFSARYAAMIRQVR
jgi:predicted phosphodiesterase